MRYCSRQSCRKKLDQEWYEIHGFVYIDGIRVRFNFCKECSKQMQNFFTSKKIRDSKGLVEYINEERKNGKD